MHRSLTTKLTLVLLLGAPLRAQETRDSTASAPAKLLPATKLEAFAPAAGSIWTIAYTNIGSVRGIDVDARDIRTGDSPPVRGVTVRVTEGLERSERSFVDVDEVPELLRGIDALLEIKTNPTKQKNFEVSYMTRGELRITVYNGRFDRIHYAVRAGRVYTANRNELYEADLVKLRALLAQALTALESAP